MIDDQAKARQLLQKMEQNLPIPARPTSVLVQILNRQGIKIARDEDLLIKHVFYMGDEGGISCDITPPQQKDPLICSLTQIRVKARHPLAEEIRVYQTERRKNLARSEDTGAPAFLTIKPRRKRRG